MYSKNYMQERICEIAKIISNSLIDPWEMTNLKYNSETSSIECLIKMGSRQPWKFTYSFANYPTFESFLDSLKVDVAITNIACNYPELSIIGTALSKNVISVKTENNERKMLPILRDCVNLENGEFDTTSYYQQIKELDISLPTFRSGNVVPEKISSPFQTQQYNLK